MGFKKYGSPIYTSSWGPHGILLGGGGGDMKCGLKNKYALIAFVFQIPTVEFRHAHRYCRESIFRTE